MEDIEYILKYLKIKYITTMDTIGLHRVGGYLFSLQWTPDLHWLIEGSLLLFLETDLKNE